VELFFGWLLLSAVTASETSPLGRALASPGLTFFGKYSYGAYMLHALLRPAYLRLFPPAALQRAVHFEVAGFVAFALLATAVTFLLAMACFHLYEARFLALKRFFEYRPLAGTPAAQASARGDARASEGGV
jgi:peptidoglycan/LPS O-acetylase OafA/YrhL